jgi:hypothetical protein
MRKVLESCPSCGGALEITEVRCTACETEVRSRYRLCDFCALNEEQSVFLRIFVTSRGNLSEVEKRLGVSYPTVRAKLDEIIGRLDALEQAQRSVPPAGPKRRGPAQPGPRSLGANEAASSGAQSGYRQILEAVARGEISAAEGVIKIRVLGGDHGGDAHGEDVQGVGGGSE